MAGILVVAEHVQGRLLDISGELIGAAAIAKEKLGGPLTAVILSDEPEGFAEQVDLEGVDEIVAARVGTPHFDAAIYEEVVCRLGAELKPRVILFGHTVNGMACSAAVAARLGCGYASDVFRLDVEAGELVVTRSAYGNKLSLELGFPNKGVVTLSLRGATFKAPEKRGSARVTVKEIELSGVDGTIGHLEYQEAPPADIDISKAEFILCVGRGIQDKENLPRFAALASRIGATLGCSRPIVDQGWLPRPHQVGQSGTVASNCKLYLAFGISGAVEHLYGMKHVDTIIAVNSDPSASIFNVATYGACTDLFELTEALERRFD